MQVKMKFRKSEKKESVKNSIPFTKENIQTYVLQVVTFTFIFASYSSWTSMYFCVFSKTNK